MANSWATTGQKFDGIRAALENQTRASNRPVRILFVHGMITDREDYSLPTQRALALQLGLCKSKKACEPETSVGLEDRYPLPRGYNPVMQFYGQSLETAFPKDASGKVSAPSSVLTRYVWKRDNQPALIVYSLFWAPTRDWVKNSLLGCFESYEAVQARNNVSQTPKPLDTICPPEGSFGATRNTDKRLWFNGQVLKDNLMVNGFGDAVTVVGAAGAVLEDDVQLAYCVMANDILSDATKESALLKAAGEEANKSLSSSASAKDRADATREKLKQNTINLEAKSFDLQVKTEDKRCSLESLTNARTEKLVTALAETPFFTVTESLGSYLTLKAHLSRQTHLSTKPSASSERIAFFALLDNATIYMHANQISLLALTDLRARCVPSDLETSCPVNDSRLRQTNSPNPILPTPPRTTVVAFNDRADALGYELPPFLGQSGYFGSLVNISVSNPAFTVPGLLKWPMDAHTNQQKNHAIIQFMVEGFSPPVSAPK
ncbi:hypothetical protein [Candidatus Phycosocius spiralis]|uniref:Uncharacterized protein n=1 Tax=Candidatus Phycosocius spiralis TaxID=2815099 RepID=A0ABQ4PT36_9PROT|nr:hypothetical protein [Candidatus Phycosocius spiralis]GIU66110.1 hypothetical protein PsB1_0264 [Candidatus Phycosocius spiralis]